MVGGGSGLAFLLGLLGNNDAALLFRDLQLLLFQDFRRTDGLFPLDPGRFAFTLGIFATGRNLSLLRSLQRGDFLLLLDLRGLFILFDQQALALRLHCSATDGNIRLSINFSTLFL